MSERRKEAIQDFYKAYRELKRYYDLRLQTHTEQGETVIKIDRYRGNIKGECILRVTQETEIDAYEQATKNIKTRLS